MQIPKRLGNWSFGPTPSTYADNVTGDELAAPKDSLESAGVQPLRLRGFGAPTAASRSASPPHALGQGHRRWGATSISPPAISRIECERVNIQLYRRKVVVGTTFCVSDQHAA